VKIFFIDKVMFMVFITDAGFEMLDVTVETKLENDQIGLFDNFRSDY